MPKPRPSLAERLQVLMIDDDVDDHSELLEQESAGQETAGQETRSRFVRALLWVPLLVSVACLLFAVARPALPGPKIPVTGDPLVPPTPGANETVGPQPNRQIVDDPAMPYKDEAALRLDVCNAAFHSFFILEQVAIHQPDLTQSETWQQDAARAVQDFRDDCQPLGAMPFVPSAYKDVDRWLKLASAEVTPAAESFAAQLDGSDSAHQDEAFNHLLRFLEYTGKAQELMDRLERRKQV